MTQIIRQYAGGTGIFALARIFDPTHADDGKVLRTDTEAFETYSAGQFANYVLTFAAGTFTYEKVLTVPSWVPDGTILAVHTYERQAGSPATTDLQYSWGAPEVVAVRSDVAGSVSSEAIAGVNLYAGLEDLKDDAGDNSAVRDYMLGRRLESASRMIDRYTGREFFVTTETRYVDAPSNRAGIVLRDVLSLSSVTEDTDGDYDYTDQTWTPTTDYILYPFNTFPKRGLNIVSLSGKVFYGIRKGLKLVGEFGYGDGQSATPYRATGATLGAGASSSTTSLTVSDGTLFQAGWTLLVGTEKVAVLRVNSNTLTVQRGLNGSTAASHLSGDTVYRYLVPADVEETCLMIAMRLLNRGPEHGRQSVNMGMDSETMEPVNARSGLTATEEGRLFGYVRRPGL